MPTLKTKHLIKNVKDKYDPEHDVFPNVPVIVTFTEMTLLRCIELLYQDIERLEAKIEKLTPKDRPARPQPSEPGRVF